MLTRTFLHIPGVGQTTERRLWDGGLLDWDCVLGAPSSALPARCRRILPDGVRDSRVALQRGDIRFFGERLPPGQLWRLYPVFGHRAAFLDIETTGMDASSYVTSIALFDGRRVRTYVHDENLHEFPRDIRDYELLVTYNGKCFDVPFLQREFPTLRLDQPHIDLRYFLASLGYTGGLKAVERKMGIPREPYLRDVDGLLAVHLWWAHLRGDRRALPALLRYNIEDTMNLRWLMETAYNLAVGRLPIAVETIPVSARPNVEQPYDPSIIEELVSGLSTAGW